MPKLDCELCLPDIGRYYDDSFNVVVNNQILLSMAASHPQGSKVLASGRVVVVRDGVGHMHPGRSFL